ncbi:LuxR C-terminal-related transcriptional regulator [Streptacidiphilus sp. EB129]|jgi:DNA-binding NarL/FixJ family response regulator|uniref:LuxR C-terminal-related transcriptional regulator n=1 Tax=Streptacidiphilus sp. EB129 TaxID=3156262 RepID=UPI00351143CB
MTMESIQRAVELRDACARVAPLSPRRRQVLNLVLQDFSNQQIAQHMGISERTVKAHVSELMQALGVSSRVCLAQVALLAQLETCTCGQWCA